jgi:hypothetical protein
LIRNVHGSQDHVDHGNDRSGLTGTGETLSGLRLVARNQDVVVLAPEARRSIADGGICGQKRRSTPAERTREEGEEGGVQDVRHVTRSAEVGLVWPEEHESGQN